MRNTHLMRSVIFAVLLGFSINTILAGGKFHPVPTLPNTPAGPVWGKTEDYPDSSGPTVGWYKSWLYKYNTTNKYEKMRIDTRSYYVPLGWFACYTRDMAECVSAAGACNGPGSDVWSRNPSQINPIPLEYYIVTQHKYTQLGTGNSQKFFTGAIGFGVLTIEGTTTTNLYNEAENPTAFAGFGVGLTGCTDPTP